MRLFVLLVSCFWLLISVQAQKPIVVCTASMIADMANQLGQDMVEVKSIVPIGGDPHTHEPTPADASMVNEADLIFVNGLTFEGWLNELIAFSGTKAPVVTVTKNIKPIQSLTYTNSFDPHAWMDASLGLVYIKNIRDALIDLAPQHEQSIDENYEAYRQKLQALDAYILERIAEIPEQRRVLITSHDAFQYYGDRYGIQLEAILGTSTDAEARTSDIARVTSVIRKNELPAVFIESTVNPKLLKQIAQDNQVKIGGSLYSDSLGDEDSPAATYYDMLKYNTDLIVEALKSPKVIGQTALKSKPQIWVWLLGISSLFVIGLVIYRRANG